MINNHTQLIQALIDKYSLKSYLEIGVQNTEKNFLKINCEFRVGVDPIINDIIDNNYRLFKKTSNQFFESKIEYEGKPFYFDIIFIDGLHEAEQVKRDFENSLKCLTDNGFILIHDTLPEKEETTLIPRVTRQWHGDVYKFAMSLIDYDGIHFKTFNIDEGCTLVWKDKSRRGDKNAGPEINFKNYMKFRTVLLNIVDEVII